MKKIASIFCVALIAISYAGVSSAQQTADSEKEALRAQVAELQAALKKLEQQFKAQVDTDMEILAKVRAENRDLKKQLRKAKRDDIEAKIAATPSTTATAKSASSSTSTQTSTAAKSSVSTSETPKVEKKSDENYKLPSSKKSESIWDNMFPF